MTAVHLDNVSKSFGGVQVIKGISLSIQKGEFVSLLGPSGCGKTTLLRMIAGLEEANGGSIHIGGKDSTRLPPERRDIAMVFQSYALLPHLNVLENVMFPLRMRRLGNRAEQRERAEAALKLVQLSHLAERRPRQLSGGQQQRVAVARAVVSSPQVLLLDEPLSNLDAKLRETMQEELIQLHRQTGLTTVFVTHDQEEALEVADRVVVINKGRIEQVGTPQDVWENPASPFVYGFLGDVNLFHGRAHEGEVHVEGIRIDAPEHQGAQDAKAFAYVRPHDLDVQRYSPGQGVDAAGRPRGIVAQLSRAIVVGPIARLELIAVDDRQPGDPARPESLIEAQIPAQQFRDQGFKEGETLVLTPQRARVFVETAH